MDEDSDRNVNDVADNPNGAYHGGHSPGAGAGAGAGTGTGTGVGAEAGHHSGGRTVVLMYTDLMFGVRLQDMARAAGLDYAVARPGTPLPAGHLLVVDLSTRGDWEAAIREAAGKGMPVVAFGPHMDTGARRRARQAGAGRVLTNSNLARDLPPILQMLSLSTPSAYRQKAED